MNVLQAITIPTLTPTLSLKYLHKLILQNFLESINITHPNGTHSMTSDKFTHYYNAPNKIEKLTLGHAMLLLCSPTCHNQCTDPCLIHTTPNTIKNEYII